MKFFIIICLSIFLSSNLFSNDFAQKKIVKIQQNEDDFKLIDLQQNVINSNLDEQEALFDSSTLIEKKPSIIKDKDKDFAIVLSFRQNFGYFSDGIKVDAKDFSTEFSKKLINDLSLNFTNSAANGLYQSSDVLLKFSPKDSKFVNVAPFLKQELDKNKIYSKFIDYLIIVNLDDFYVITTNYFIAVTKNAIAKVNFKIISLDKGRVIVAKNARLSLALDAKDSKKNYQNVSEQMPKMLSKIINKELISFIH
ncbi:hypothetical protein [Campylobacter estrildidarum]|uniref:Periplasmic protein n=1 Tax=Campylobacter estrildidarum TaxID=2510189 RepID=A0A4U7BKV2_9BACT|nr:hypothetical protein [Campylobacter estrildidarum]TKX31131.1 hypothetical protein CQA69_04090 [Campylobacter estrildidarum]